MTSLFVNYTVRFCRARFIKRHVIPHVLLKSTHKSSLPGVFVRVLPLGLLALDDDGDRSNERCVWLGYLWRARERTQFVCELCI